MAKGSRMCVNSLDPSPPTIHETAGSSRGHQCITLVDDTTKLVSCLALK